MKDFDYKLARNKLDELINWFEGEDINVEEALSKYKQADDLINQIEKYLTNTKTKIEQVINKTSSD